MPMPTGMIAKSIKTIGGAYTDYPTVASSEEGHAMKERNDFEQWNDYVNSFERNEAWRMSLEIANMVLEAYFQSRDSFPGTSLMGEDLVDDSKTTDEIVEEVSTMMDIDKEIVAIWMRYHGFHIKTMEDGTVKWAIWRDMKPLL